MNVPGDTAKPKYKAGQLWSYRNRPQEPNSALVIVKVDPSAAHGNIIHVSLAGLRVKNPLAVNGYTDFITHMPFSEEAIDKSVVKLLLKDVGLPDYEEGYEVWKKEYEAGRASIFTGSVAEGIEAMEKILSR